MFVTVCLFVYVYVSGWVLDSSSLGTSRAPTYLPPPHSLPVADDLTSWCIVVLGVWGWVLGCVLSHS